MAMMVPVFGGGRRGRSLVRVRWTGSRVPAIELTKLKPRFLLAVVQNWTALLSVDVFQVYTLHVYSKYASCTHLPTKKIHHCVARDDQKFRCFLQDHIFLAAGLSKYSQYSGVLSGKALAGAREGQNTLDERKAVKRQPMASTVETTPCSLSQTLPVP
jgi:hypothetical protein